MMLLVIKEVEISQRDFFFAQGQIAINANIQIRI